ALRLRVERDAPPIDDRVVAVEREARRCADVGPIRGADLNLVLAGFVAARAREAEVEARALEDLAAAVREVDVEALDRRRLVLERLAIDDWLAVPIDEGALVDRLLGEEELDGYVRRGGRARKLDRHEDVPGARDLVDAGALQLEAAGRGSLTLRTRKDEDERSQHEGRHVGHAEAASATRPNFSRI